MSNVFIFCMCCCSHTDNARTPSCLSHWAVRVHSSARSYSVMHCRLGRTQHNNTASSEATATAMCLLNCRSEAAEAASETYRYEVMVKVDHQLSDSLTVSDGMYCWTVVLEVCRYCWHCVKPLHILHMSIHRPLCCLMWKHSVIAACIISTIGPPSQLSVGPICKLPTLLSSTQSSPQTH